MIWRPVAGPAEVSGNGLITGIARAGDRWEVSFVSEPRTSPQPLWFHVTVAGVGGAAVAFRWQNADITLGARDELHLLRPVLRADEGAWERCAGVEVDESPDGRQQVRFEHPGGADKVAAALCYPYAPQDLEATVAAVGDLWEQAVIGATGEGRPLLRLRLAGASGAGTRPGLYLLARQHAGETPGSWVLDGILRFLAGDDKGRELGQALDVWAVPFVDLDGVVNGDYGKDALPWDFNRAWEPLAMRPAVHALQRDLMRFAARTTPRLVIDLHAPGHSTPDVYVQLPRQQRPHEQQAAAMSFVARLAEQFPELDADTLGRPTVYPSRWNAMATAGSWVWHHLDRTACVAIETSYQRLNGRELDPDGYRDVGRRVLLAAWAWLQAQGTRRP
ncbi:MAG: M14 family zinc carboxypeptidase [Armatimonadota bacterium]